MNLWSAGKRMYIGGKMSPADALLRGFAETCARQRAKFGRFLMPCKGIWQGKLLENTGTPKSDRPPACMSMNIGALIAVADHKFTLVRRPEDCTLQSQGWPHWGGSVFQGGRGIGPEKGGTLRFN